MVYILPFFLCILRWYVAILNLIDSEANSTNRQIKSLVKLPAIATLSGHELLFISLDSVMVQKYDYGLTQD